MIRRAIFAILLLIVATHHTITEDVIRYHTDIQSNSITGIDGYKFGPKEYEKERVIVTLITYRTEEEFRAAVASKPFKLTDTSRVAAFSITHGNTNYCEIHIFHPETKYAPHHAGHELYHCFYGNWHQ